MISNFLFLPLSLPVESSPFDSVLSDDILHTSETNDVSNGNKEKEKNTDL